LEARRVSVSEPCFPDFKHTLKKPHAEREDDAHDPEFKAANVQTVEWVGDVDEGEVDVDREDC